MLHVKLLVDVAEGGRDLAKARAAADAFGMGKKDPKYPTIKTTGKCGVYRAGAIVTMHEASAAKWIAAGLCEVVAAPQPVTEAAPA